MHRSKSAPSGSIRIALRNLFAAALFILGPSVLVGDTAQPIVTISPATINATVGDDVTFNLVSDSTTATYQWQRNGTPMEGETGLSLTLSDVRLTDADRYDVQVTDAPSSSVFNAEASLLRVFPATFPTVIAPNPGWSVKLEGGDLATQRRLFSVFPLPDQGGIVLGLFASFEGHETYNSARIDSADAVNPAYRGPTANLAKNFNSNAQILMDGPDHFMAIVNPAGFQPSGDANSTVARFDLNGNVDPSFVLDDEVKAAFDQQPIGAIAIDQNRRVLIGWSTSNPSVAEPNVITLVRTLADGTWDKTFPSQVFDQSVDSILVQADGALLIGGKFTELNGNAVAPMVRLAADGTFDSTFATNLTLPTVLQYPRFLAHHETSSGELYLSGYWQDSAFQQHGVLDHLSADGTLIQRWEFNNAVTRFYPRADGTFVIAGHFSQLGEAPLRGIGKIDTSGNITEMTLPFDNYFLEDFNATSDGSKAWMIVYHNTLNQRHWYVMDLADGSASEWIPHYEGIATATAIEPLANGGWLVAGDFSSANGVPTSNMVRLSASGDVVGTYGEDWGPQGSINRLQRRSDGKINVIPNVAIPGQFLYRRLSPDGTVDPTFAPELNSSSASLLMLDLPAGETLLTSWYLGFENGFQVTAKRLLIDGNLDPTFPPPTAYEFPALAGLVQRDGSLLLGALLQQNGAPPIRRYNAEFEFDQAYVNNAAITENSIFGLAAAYDDSDWVLSYQRLFRLDSDGNPLAASDPDQSPLFWSFPSDFPIAQTIALPDGDMLMANFNAAKFGGVAAPTPVARINPDLTIDTDNFSLIGVDQEVNALRLTDSGNILMAVPGRVFMTKDASDFNATVSADTEEEALLAGQSITFTVQDQPAGELTYQWRKNGQPIDGATGPSLMLTGLTVEDAGDYDVVIDWALGQVITGGYTLAVNAAPTITTPPADQVVLRGSTTTFTVEATGSDSLTYAWRQNSIAIPNATSATLVISDTALADAGDYDVVVSNPTGSTTSAAASLTVVDMEASHAVVGAGYTAGGTVTITNTITYSGAISSLGWTIMPPDAVDGQKWSYHSSGGDVAEDSPQSGDTDLLDWAWTTVPASPIVFTYTLNVPANATGEKSLVGMVKPRVDGVQLEALVPPDPLVMNEDSPFHSADTDRDSRISLSELLRVIELYNFREGTQRTGQYHVAPEGQDGFAPGPDL